jgi:hypothetical protein
VVVGGTNAGAAGNFGGTAAASVAAAGGRDGGRGGAGRLRLADGGAESGRCRTGGGGGRLRTGPEGAPSVAFGDDGGGAAALDAEGEGGVFEALGGAAAAGDDGGLLSRGRGGTEGGTELRPEAGLGGEGFLDWFASSAMVHELTPSLKRAKRERNRGKSGPQSVIRTPPAAGVMLCDGAL